ncbi:MAG TPA: VWA domain-containing protein [Acidobacteriota bacterium]|nr:VWA domain-containing protein [Acidobacteriota bacterium]
MSNDPTQSFKPPFRCLNQRNLTRQVVFLFIVVFCAGWGWQLTPVPIVSSFSQTGEKQSSKQTDDEPILRLRSDLVTVNITVSDKLGRFVTGLKKTDFQVYENGVLQSIEYFSDIDGPISVGIIFDVSYSMRHSIDARKEEVRAFVESCLEGDEFFLVTFNNKVQQVSDFTSSGETIVNTVALTKTGGQTALYDAVYFGLEKLRNARHPRKALIVLSDLDDNSSRYSLKELRKLVTEMDVKVYWMPWLSELTGGYSTWTSSSLEESLRQIAFDLRRQYSLGYIPSNEVLTRDWNKISVKVKPPKGLPKIVVHAREGYAPTFLGKP